MTNQNPIIESIWSFTWGISNDEFAGQGWHFWDWRNADIRSNSRKIKLSNYINNQYFATWGQPRAIYGNSTSTILSFNSNGTISSYANPTARTHTSTATGSNTYANIVPYGTISGKQWILILAWNYIHTLAYDNTSLPWTVVENNWTFVNNNTAKPYCIFNGDLLIGDGNMIQKIERTWSAYVPSSGAFGSVSAATNPALIEVDLTETILGIFELWDQIVFFTNKAQYFWDWYNFAYDRRVPWDQEIRAVEQYKTSFYVVTHDLYTMIWKTSTGYDRVPLQKDESYDPTLSRLAMQYSYDNSMVLADWILYFWWYGDWELNTYWAYNPWMPESFIKYVTGTWAITALSNTSLLLFFWWYTGTTYYVWFLDKRRQTTNAYTTKDLLVELTPEIWQDEATNKEMVKIRIWYKLQDSWCMIPIYSKVNDESDKFTFCAASYTTLPLAWATYTHNSSTYTVLSTTTSVWGKLWITAQRTTWTTIPTTTWTLTKSTWTWDSSVAFVYFVPYRIIWLVDGSNSTHLAEYRQPLMYNTMFNKIQFAIWATTDNAAYSPEIYSFTWEYNNIQNDL